VYAEIGVLQRAPTAWPPPGCYSTKFKTVLLTDVGQIPQGERAAVRMWEAE